ncbi:MAG TPA: glycoside hydrolase family 19 protein [Leptolyngbyaceae cyanobacterium]
MEATQLKMKPAQLKAYRQAALDKLEQLLLDLPEEAREADYFVDKYIRILSQKSERPADAPPYVGLYGPDKTLDEYRDIATDRLQELAMRLPDLDVVDEEADKYIRILSEVAPRSNDAQPYVDLFVLRDEKASNNDLPSLNGNGSFANSAPTYITTEQLLEIIGSTDLKSRIESLVPGVNQTFDKFQINTKLRMAHFLAQVIHESGGFRWLREIWGPTAIQQRYEGRRDLGNIHPGDGKRFMGRGAIQLTGRANYEQFSSYMGVDFIKQPELVESSPYAVIVAGWYWDSRKINAPADNDDLNRVTRLINGGTIGLADRQKYLLCAKKVLGI